MTGGPAGWHDYATEGALLAIFMVSACAFTILAEHPLGLLAPRVPEGIARRLFVGIAMAITAGVLIYSRPGRRTGAHMNPAVTLALSRLGSIPNPQVIGYVTAQFAGGIAGMAVATLLFGPALEHKSVNFVVTRPGAAGAPVAFVAECLMTLLMMSAVLHLSNHRRYAAYTGVASAALLAAFITVEAPLSGMSLNPARTLGPALFAGEYSSLWVYFVAPPAGMYLAVRAFMWQCRSGACPHGFHGARA